MAPIDIVIDCDPGIDDALALALAAASPELNLRAVTCVSGNRPVETTSRNARGLLDLFGAPEVPVYTGAGQPLNGAAPSNNLVHGEDGLGGIQIDRSSAIRAGHGADFLAEILLSAAGPDLVLVATGPLTNLAQAEIRHPGVLARARAVMIMGGAMRCPGNVTPTAEFNFFADAPAAWIVMHSGAALRLFPLDVTSQAAMTPDWLDGLAALPSRSAQALSAMLRAYGLQDPLLHDVCPVAALIEPSLFSGEIGSVSIEVEADARKGQCRFSPGLANTEVFFKTKEKHLLEVIATRLVDLP